MLALGLSGLARDHLGSAETGYRLAYLGIWSASAFFQLLAIPLLWPVKPPRVVAAAAAAASAARSGGAGGDASTEEIERLKQAEAEVMSLRAEVRRLEGEVCRLAEENGQLRRGGSLPGS